MFIKNNAKIILFCIHKTEKPTINSNNYESTNILKYRKKLEKSTHNMAKTTCGFRTCRLNIISKLFIIQKNEKKEENSIYRLIIFCCVECVRKKNCRPNVASFSLNNFTIIIKFLFEFSILGKSWLNHFITDRNSFFISLNVVRFDVG